MLSGALLCIKEMQSEIALLKDKVELIELKREVKVCEQ